MIFWNYKVVVILVNWRQVHRTISAITAIKKQSISCQIIVVDNGSNDDSVATIKNLKLEGLDVIENKSNLGFGCACNMGLQAAIEKNADYVWILNNDCIPERSCLLELLKVATMCNKIGIIGARIKDPNSKLDDHTGSVMNLVTLNCRYTLSESDLNKSFCSWITGACMLININALQEVGYFDVGYFMYWEDADLCSRFREAGYKLAISHNAVVYHSSGTSSDKIRSKRFEWHIYSQYRWLSKFHPYKEYSYFVMFSRHLIKSIISKDIARFKITLLCGYNILFQ